MQLSVELGGRVIEFLSSAEEVEIIWLDWFFDGTSTEVWGQSFDVWWGGLNKKDSIMSTQYFLNVVASRDEFGMNPNVVFGWWVFYLPHDLSATILYQDKNDKVSPNLTLSPLVPLCLSGFVCLFLCPSLSGSHAFSFFPLSLSVSLSLCICLPLSVFASSPSLVASFTHLYI